MAAKRIVSVAPAAGGFSAALGVDTTVMTRTPSGLRYQDVTVGSGTTQRLGKPLGCTTPAGCPTGRSSTAAETAIEPFGFTLGAGQVIAGWDEGVAGMKVGGVASSSFRRILVMGPPELLRTSRRGQHWCSTSSCWT